MSSLHIDHAVGRDGFLGQVRCFSGAVEELTDRQLLSASRCHGWTALDVVVHVRTGLQEMLGAVVSPTTAPPDRDAASYWVSGEPTAAEPDDVAAILWTRRTSSAYRMPRGALEHLTMAVDALTAAVSLMPEGYIRFQGHVLHSGDFLATWAVELAVHHLDLGPDLPVPPPTTPALRLGRRTVDALLGTATPALWDDGRCLLLGSGRVVPSSQEQEELGMSASAVAVLG